MLIRNLVSRSVKVGMELREVCRGLLGKRQELRSRMPMRPIQQQLGSYSWRRCVLRMLTTKPDGCEYMHGTESGRIYLGFIRVFVFYVTSETFHLLDTSCKAAAIFDLFLFAIEP